MNRFGQMTDVVGMHGGLPPPCVFPIAAMTLQLAQGGGAATIDHAKPISDAQQYNLDLRVRGLAFRGDGWAVSDGRRKAAHEPVPAAALVHSCQPCTVMPACRATRRWCSGHRPSPRSCSSPLSRWRWP